LPPKQCSDYQVEVGGKIRLACRGGARRSAHYKQATSRQRPEIPAGEMAQPSAYSIPYHGRTHLLADNETDSRGFVRIIPDQQMTR
jgi:hypothetical protein